MSSRRSSPWPMVVAMLVASVGVHLLLWPVGNEVLSLTWESPPLPPAGGIMEVSLISPDPDDPEAVPPPPEPDRLDMPEKVVAPDRVLDERPPDDSSLGAEFDSRTDHPTKAPNRARAERYDSTTLGELAGVPAPPQAPQQDPVPPHALPLGRFDRERVDELGHPIDPGDLGGGKRGDSDRSQSSTAPPPRPGWRGNADAMRKTFGGSGTYDDLQGIDEGTESILDTHRFKYASFFNRMRDQIAQHWDPNETMQRIDPEGRVYGRRTRKTMLHIQLTPKGAIQRIRTVDGSGVIDLDKEAIESVQLAAPFVNPPPQMVDAKTGFIEIDFLFILEDGKTTIHRYLR